MKCVSTSVWKFTTVILLCGVAPLAHGQEAEDELRMDTDFGEEEVMPPPPPNEITIGDDSTDSPRRVTSDVDAYAAQGLPAGAFRLYPSLEIGSAFSSNARRASSGAKADVSLRIKPQLRIESNWVRHSLTGSASFEGQQFLGNSDINSVAGSVQGALRLDVRRQTKSDIDWSYAATSTGIEDSELPATATGSRLDHVLTANAGVTHDFGGVEGRLRFGLSRNLYGDVDLSGGGTEDNKDRNYTQLSVAARVGLKTGGKIQPFGEVAYEPRLYDEKRDRTGTARNSQGLRLSAGVTLADEPLWSGQLAASLELRDYSDNSLGTALLPGLQADVTWQPTDLTRFEFSAGASLSETVAAGVSGTQNWTAGVTATHALRENLDLVTSLRFRVERSDGETSLSTDSTLGLNWTVNPYVILGTSYEHAFVQGTSASGGYDDHRLLASIILRR